MSSPFVRGLAAVVVRVRRVATLDLDVEVYVEGPLSDVRTVGRRGTAFP